jgi:hypothetical protein
LVEIFNLEIGNLNKEIREYKLLFEQNKKLLINKLDDLQDLDVKLVDLIESDFKISKLKKANPKLIEEVSDEDDY